MARPAKNVSLISKNLTKEERRKRLEAEEKMRGDNNRIEPPEYLTDDQVEVFNYIVQEMRESNVLGNIDVYVLGMCAVAVDRIQSIEQAINNDPSILSIDKIIKIKEKYVKEFFRCCGELCLSPQSRAKIGVINANKKNQDNDPLIQALTKKKA